MVVKVVVADLTLGSLLTVCSVSEVDNASILSASNNSDTVVTKVNVTNYNIVSTDVVGTRSIVCNTKVSVWSNTPRWVPPLQRQARWLGL